ncbi:Putative Ctr copper transporter [Septoria linicola]|uniref:Copper transport protein n=1 Tax=Septoria linicola TaxID=215465 RepID=A0A9Q9AW32_9PEZI|nr:Putative Ctr copper transporter [Septoria linicola]
MDMSMSGMDMPTSTSMDSMASSTATASSDMSATMHGSMMGMSEMMMVFFTSTNTALYSDKWMPSSIGQYAGTCIFLICLGVVFRGLVALRSNFEVIWSRSVQRQDTSILRQIPGVEPKTRSHPRPWRVNEAATRASLDTILAGVSYLLMLAVMTMNVGYFLSVLGGVFLGSFVLGGLGNTVSH